MKIFPAIDIKDKKCVRLIKGDFNQKTEYEMSPVEQATQFIDKGFNSLVDSTSALSCYYIRTLNKRDPADIYDYNNYDIKHRSIIKNKISKTWRPALSRLIALSCQ